MKKLLAVISVPLIVGCNITKSDSDLSCDNPIKAEYDRLISYNDFQAHHFQSDQTLFLYSNHQFTVGETYLLCIDGDRITDYTK